MCTGGSYDYDDVVRALVRLDRLEMRPGTSGQSGKTAPTNFTDPEVEALTIVPSSESWTQPSMGRPHWNEILDALQEDADFCETTIARDGAIAIPGVFFNNDDGHESIKENEVPQAGSTSFPTPWVPGRPRGSQCCADVLRFLRPQTMCKWQRSGTAHEALEHSTAEIANEVCKMSQTWTLGSRVSRRESRTTQRRKVRSTRTETWRKLKRVCLL